MKQPAYRATVYAPRSVDPTEATVLTPRAGAPHADPFKIASVQNLAGYKPYLDTVRGRRSAIDPIEKRVDTGQMTLRYIDARAGTPSDNLTRWATAFVGDAAGANLLVGCKVVLEESLDYDEATGVGTWNPFYVGRFSSHRLNGRLWFESQLRDINDGLDVDVFVGQPHTAVWNYAKQAYLWPIGLSQPYGDFPQVPAAVGSVTAIPVYLDGAGTLRSWPNDQWYLKVDTTLFPQWRQLIPKLWRDYWGSSTKFVAEVTPYFGGATTEWLCVGGSGGTSPDTLYFMAKPDGSSGAFPAVGALLSIRLRPVAFPVSDELPLIVNDVHPATFWKHLLAGYFGHLNPDGTVKWSVGYDAAAFAALEADPTFPTVRFILPKRESLSDWIEANLLQPCHLAYYTDAQGRIVPVDCRRTSTIVPTTPLTADDLATDEAPTWEQSNEAVTAVEVTLYADRLAPANELPTPNAALPLGYQYPTRSTLLEEAADYVVRLEDFGSRAQDMKQRVLKIDAKGLRARYIESDANSLAAEQLNGRARLAVLKDYAASLASELKAPYGAGATYIGLTCRRASANVANIWPGKWVPITVNAIPDAATVKRGGTRLGFCIERNEDGPRVRFRFVDAGANAVALAPTIGQPTVSATQGDNVVSLPVTLNAAGEPVDVYYAVTDQATAVRPADASALWTYAGNATATATYVFTKLPAGSRIWFKGRTAPKAGTAFKLPSAWAYAGGTGRADTTGLAAPTGIAAQNITQGSADIVWNNPNRLRVVIYVNQGGVPGTWDDTLKVATLREGSTKFSLYGLSGPNVQHTVGVAFLQDTGGEARGSVGTVTFNTSAVSSTAPRPAGIAIASWGGDAAANFIRTPK